MAAGLLTGDAVSAFRRASRGALAGALALLLAACAGSDVDDGRGRTIELPAEWDPVDIGEADLDLPLRTPFEIRELRQRVGALQLFQNLYSFQGVNGYLMTSRVFVGRFSGNAAAEIGDQEDFLNFAEAQSIVRRRNLTLEPVEAFRHPRLHSTGYYTRASAERRGETCFVVRVGFLLTEDSFVEREPDDIDTIVAGTLCSLEMDEDILLALLTRLQVVRDRDGFREALSKRRIGTI